MAVNVNNNQSQPQAQMQQPVQTQSTGGAPTGSAGFGATSMMDMLASGRAPVGPRSNSELLNKVSAAITNVIKRENKEVLPEGWNVIALDHNNIGGPASVVAVCAMKRTAQSAGIYVTNVLLEGSMESLAPSIETRPGRQSVQITTTLGQVFDNEFWSKIQKRIAEQYGIGIEAVRQVSTIVLPREFDLENQDAVTTLTYLATVASAIASSGGEALPLSIPQALKEQGQQFVTRVDMSVGQTTNMLGRPTRSAMSVRTLLTRAANAQATYRNEHPLFDLAVYVDINFTGPTAVPQQYPNAPAVMGTQVYTPELVINGIHPSFYDFDLARALFCIIGVGALEKGSSWARSFLRTQTGRNKKGQIDITNIGALGYELSETEGKMIETGRESGFGAEALATLLQRYFYQVPAVSIDLDPNAPLNWVMNDFIAAGQDGAPEQAAAKQRIIAAANSLTGNAFAKYFQSDWPICVQRHYLATGTYVNDDGEVRDLAEIDYLAILNIFGGTDKSVVKEWQRSFEDQTITPMEGLAIREGILRSRLNDVKITGYKRRETFDKRFLAALETGLVECGYRPMPEGIQPVIGQQVVRGNQSLQQLAGQALGQAMYAPGVTTNQQGGGHLNGMVSSYTR